VSERSEHGANEPAPERERETATNPFVVATGELLRRHGSRTRIRRRGSLSGVALSMSRLDGGVELEATLEAQGSTVTAAATVTGHWTGECRRCLEATGGDLQVELREVFEPDPVEGETYPLARDHVDLTPAVRDALTLALPLAPLCDEACAGPDPAGHPVGRPGQDEAWGDPRWAVLDELRFDR
jgi:uncharacterized protein